MTARRDASDRRESESGSSQHGTLHGTHSASKHSATLRPPPLCIHLSISSPLTLLPTRTLIYHFTCIVGSFRHRQRPGRPRPDHRLPSTVHSRLQQRPTPAPAPSAPALAFALFPLHSQGPALPRHVPSHPIPSQTRRLLPVSPSLSRPAAYSPLTIPLGCRATDTADSTASSDHNHTQHARTHVRLLLHHYTTTPIHLYSLTTTTIPTVNYSGPSPSSSSSPPTTAYRSHRHSVAINNPHDTCHHVTLRNASPPLSLFGRRSENCRLALGISPPA